MRKLLVLVVVALFPLLAAAQQPPQAPPNFMGTWTLGLSSGRMVDVNGNRQEFSYAELPINISTAQQNEGGSVSYAGNVAGHSGSSVTVFYNPAYTPRYVDVYVYINEPELAGAYPLYFYQMTFRLFIAPDGSYSYGTMTALFYDNVTRGGNGALPVVLYNSDVVMSRVGGRG